MEVENVVMNLIVNQAQEKIPINVKNMEAENDVSNWTVIQAQ
jgi:hypothetical protein